MAGAGTPAAGLGILDGSPLEYRVEALLRDAARPAAWAVAAAGCVLCAAVSAAAFTPAGAGSTGAIGGTVFDASNAVVPGIKVIMRGADGRVRSGRTDAVGAVQFVDLAAGWYEMEVRAPGFRLGRGKVRVEAGVAIPVRAWRFRSGRGSIWAGCARR